MRRVILFVFIIMLTTNLFAENPYKEIWSRNDLFDTGDYDPTRGLVWNSFTDHLLVVTRTNPYPRILILDPETGSEIGVMDTTNLPMDIQTEEGIGQIDIADDGVIYVCDLGDKDSEMNFRVWKFTDENATAQLCFDAVINSGDASNTREWYGASYDIIGSGTETYLYTSGWQNNQIAVLKMGDRDWFAIDHFIPVPTMNSARHAISVIEPLGNLWINGAGTSDPPARLISNAGAILCEVPTDTMIGGAASETIHWSVGKYNIISAVHANAEAHTINSIRYEEDDLGTINLSYFGPHSDTLNTGTNINATAVLRYDNSRNWLYALDGANCIKALDLNGLAKVTTPRDTGMFAIQIDGLNNEYTNYEYMDEVDDSKFYFTWSEKMVFAGLTGTTLYAPFQQQALYFVFDTDANAGSNNAAFIGELPFDADMIVQFDSDDYADLVNGDVSEKWTTGFVYKWNGSQWNASEISGFDINYGAMAIIGDGNDNLITEIGVARNPVALGDNISQLRMKVLLAKNDGTILKSFPINNESYYEFDDLGNDLMPAKIVKRIGTGTAIDDLEMQVSDNFTLKQNYPNPFNPTTKIEYSLPKDAQVKIEVYDILGNKISTLVNDFRKAGNYHITFNGQNFASGIYLYRFTSNDDFVNIKKMMLIK